MKVRYLEEVERWIDVEIPDDLDDEDAEYAAAETMAMGADPNKWFTCVKESFLCDID